MPIRLCSYNIEWFNHLFNKDNTLKNGSDEQKRINAIAGVLSRLDPDFVGIVEGPNTSKSTTESTVTKLENFAQHASLSANKALIGYPSAGTQEISILYNPEKLIVEHSPGGDSTSKSNPPFDGEFFYDTDSDRIKEVYKHYRPPLEALVTVKSNNAKFRVIVVHTKSKGIFNSMDRLHWERESHRNRLKLFAECEWIRTRVEDFLELNEHVIVMGDINDGPEMDFYELKYGRSAVETMIGDIFEPGQLLHNFTGKPKWTSRGWKPSTARFKDRITEDYVNVLIDHILVSPGISVVAGSPFSIWNPYENNAAKPFKNDLVKASDHFPITLDLDY
jgi:endonuclease/exonuclease/phosphatase family metal-dependent hydrolase